MHAYVWLLLMLHGMGCQQRFQYDAAGVLHRADLRAASLGPGSANQIVWGELLALPEQCCNKHAGASTYAGFRLQHECQAACEADRAAEAWQQGTWPPRLVD